MTPDAATTLLDCLWHWERVRPGGVYCTQPVAPGIVVDYRWDVVADQVRRMAGHLRSLDLPPESRIALFGNNSAHWIMADLAIWTAGHVSVPLAPHASAATVRFVLDDSAARLVFVGALDQPWPTIAPFLPESLPRIALPLAPAIDAFTWDTLIARTAPWRDAPPRRPHDVATIAYGARRQGTPDGVPTTFEAMQAAARTLGGFLPLRPEDRMLSHLSFAHPEARAMVEALSLGHGFRLFFASGRATIEEDLRRARPTLAFSLPRAFMRFHADVHAKALARRRDALLLRVPFAARAVQHRILASLGLDQVRAAVTGPLPTDVAAWYRRIGLALIEGSAFTSSFGFAAPEPALDPTTAAA